MNTNIKPRLTRQRRAILGFLRSTRSHPTPDEIHNAVREAIPNISKGTVYRNLQFLIDHGEVAILNIRGTISRYEIKGETHYHFRCLACGRVFDLDEPVNRGIDDRVSKRTGFVVSGHQTEFRGWCASCRQPSQNNQKEL